MFALVVSAMMVQAVSGASPTAAESAEAARWVAAKCEGVAQAPARQADAIQVVANHGPVQLNNRAGEELRIGNSAFARGLYCHAPSRLIVHLSQPAQRFEALAGVDSRAGGGSVVFSVHGGGQGLWKSGTIRCGDAARAVNVPLKGAAEFELQVSDGGDGISCDQANWAEARVVLEDGSVLWLGDLPLVGQEEVPILPTPFFSFTYGGTPSSEFLSSWTLSRSSKKLDNTRTQHDLTYTDPKTGLRVSCRAIAYHDFPAVEWTLFFKNTGSKDTPVISDILAIDSAFSNSDLQAPVLHRIKGDDCTADSFQPIAEALGTGADLAVANTGGRPTTGAFPCFNIARSGRGMLMAISWAGQWQARFTRDNEGMLRLRAGQEGTHFLLHPGEEVRSPMIVLQFYAGDWLRGQNLWRSWMVAHNMPRQNGEALKPQTCLCTGNYYPALMTVAEQEIAFIERYAKEGIEPDYWWQDAGWYPCDGVGWPKTGTWETDPVRFPQGLRGVGEVARRHGMGTLIWFEPERVHAGTWLTENHPEWIHGGAKGGLLKLSDPECLAWLIDHIDKLITEEKIDFYRQDFNIEPLPFWRANDAEQSPEGNRQGITEIRHVENYFAYWDELQGRHPGMPIDSCASGGRRNDLETLRRAVPLLRSDWYAGPAGQQCHTYGLSLWLPFQGTGVISKKSPYWMRSSMVAEYTFGPDAAGLGVIDFEELRGALRDWRVLSGYFYGDFYPLTPYTLSESHWMAWQYDLPEEGKGVVQVFRRERSIYESARFKLRGIDAEARYSVHDVDTGGEVEMSGRELAEQGLLVTLPVQPQAGILTYERCRP